ncbi:16241_t:CDS:1, partial [Dentiscutata heterogama]
NPVTNNDNTNNDLFFEEFEEEFLQISIEAIDFPMNEDSVLESFFNISVFEQIQKRSEENLPVSLQMAPSTEGTDENWSVDDIF